MKTYTPEELKSTFESHLKWLRGEAGGTRADLTRAVLRGADLTCAVLRGADLTCAVLSGADLTRADLTCAVLRGADLTRAVLRGADLTCADLTRADLTCAVLTCAVLTRAVLRGADLRDWEGNDTIAMFAVPSLHRKMLAAIETEGCKLDMATWHQCETTHCRAGWAVQLAGPAGKALEWAIGPAAAGALIHLASCPALDGKVPDFYASNEEALADIRRLAETEPEIV